MPHPIFFDFLILSVQKVAWKFDICWVMISASKKWWLKEALCFQNSCQITTASDTRTQTSFVFKFCVGSHQDLTHKLSTASAFLNFVSDPINIRHKKTKPVVLPNFVSDPINIRHKKNKAGCVSKFCVGSRQHPTQKSKPVVFPKLVSDPNFVSDPISIRHKKNKAGGVSTFWIGSHQPLTQNESYQALNADSKTYVFPHFVSDPIRIRHKMKITL